jgi:tetrahedral aminopeptidase
MLLQELCDARGVSGDESVVREILRRAVEGSVDECRVDALGNLICLKKARIAPASPATPVRVLLAAHMDEVGLIVTGYNEDGTLRYAKVGGIDDRILLAKQVLVGDKALPGIIGSRPIHLIRREEADKAADMSYSAIDIGALTRETAEKLVQLGDYVTFRTRFSLLSADGLRTARGKAFDDRVGCAALAEVLAGEYAVDLYAVFTTQEEVGLRGAKVAGYRIDPDIALALEGTICDDLPQERERDLSPVTVLGKGPVIYLRDQSVVCDRRVVRLLSSTAESNGIPYQYLQGVIGGTDSGELHLARAGVPAGVLAVPCRYVHAPVGVVSLVDYENTVKLLVASLSRLGGELEG